MLMFIGLAHDFRTIFATLDFLCDVTNVYEARSNTDYSMESVWGD